MKDLRGLQRMLPLHLLFYGCRTMRRYLEKWEDLKFQNIQSICNQNGQNTNLWITGLTLSLMKWWNIIPVPPLCYNWIPLLLQKLQRRQIYLFETFRYKKKCTLNHVNIVSQPSKLIPAPNKQLRQTYFNRESSITFSSL